MTKVSRLISDKLTANYDSHGFKDRFFHNPIALTQLERSLLKGYSVWLNKGFWMWAPGVTRLLAHAVNVKAYNL